MGLNSFASQSQLQQQAVDMETLPPIGIPKETPKGGVHWIPEVDVSFKPVKGTIFKSIEEAFIFYKNYARKSGFNVKRGSSWKDSKKNPDEKISLKYFYCVKEGKKYNKKNVATVSHLLNVSEVDVSESNVTQLVDTENVKKKLTRRKRPSIRTGCLAKLRLNKNKDGLYVVSDFVEEHNHYLVHSQDAVFLRGNRQLKYTQQQFLVQVSVLNYGPVRGFKLMKEIFGGFEEVGATKDDCRNFRRNLKLFIGDRDAQMCVEKLMARKDFCPGYSAEYFVQQDQSLGGLFWADEDAKRYYLTFGDVVSFDATYRSNRYKMVFVPFTGIDNHNRCITFGAGLLFKEDVPSYTWLLESFKKTFGKEPNVVVTDQDPSLVQAVPIVFPNSRHRFCMWHIMQKLSLRVGTRLCKVKKFKRRLCNIVWTDKIDSLEFERKWRAIIKLYRLEENEWLRNVFDMRKQWIPAFFRHEPMSGLMRTSSRSECENHFFGKVTSSNLTLVEFLSHFDTAMDSQRYTHSKNEHDSRYTIPDFLTELKIERHAVKIYTRSIFFDVQYEIHASLNKCFSIKQTGEVNKLYTICDKSHSVRKDDEIQEDEVFDENEEEDEDEVEEVDDNRYTRRQLIEYEVLFSESEMTAVCSCKKFECFGILCRHIFCVFRIEDIDHIPKKYVLNRWVKNALPLKLNYRSHDLGSSTSAAEAASREIYGYVDACINLLVADMDKLNIFLEEQKQIKEKYENEIPIPMEVNRKEMYASFLKVKEPSKVDIINPKVAKNKGSGQHKRLKSKAEIAKQKVSTGARQCQNCFEYGHNIRTCTAIVSSQSQHDSDSSAN